VPKACRLAAILCAALIAVASAPAGAAATDGTAVALARQVIDGFHATLLDVMKNAKALGIRGRFDRFAPEIAQRFDSELMIALASGTYWRKAEPALRTKLVTAFRRMSTATYATRFTGWSGEKFETLSVEPGPRNTLIARTRIVEPEHKPVPLSYVLKKSAGTWRIVDVLAETGISELAVRRSEYRSILADGGVAALVRSLDQKTARLLGE